MTLNFLRSLLHWWSVRPRLVRASKCGHWLWYNDPGTPMYCGWECAQEGDPLSFVGG